MNWVEELYYFNEEWNPSFTEEQLIRRGSCCGLNCNNCPYSKVLKGNIKLKENEKSNNDNSSKR